MSRMDRRTFLELAGIAGASTLLAEAFPSSARADKPINFSGWVFKPDTVKDYVDFFYKKHGGQVKYDDVSSATYHPTMDIRAMAGEFMDVMDCNTANRTRRADNYLIRPLAD